MIYFTSDLHFNHTNIIKLNERPFSHINEMNEKLIANWNSCVAEEDDVYILGDFIYKSGDLSAEAIATRLNGTKYLIKGNHDKIIEEDYLYSGLFEWVKDYYVLHHQKIKFILFHYPIYEWDGYYHDAIHLHGHVHNRVARDKDNTNYQANAKILGANAINVGVDVNNYTPISMERIMQRIK